VGRGIGASLTYGASPSYNPSPDDSTASRSGQILGTALVGATGEILEKGGEGEAIITSETVVGAIPGVVDAAAGLAMAGGAVKNTAALATTPMQSSGSQTGSYTNTHESGKTYDGKGGQERSQESGKNVEKETGDKHVATDWKASSNNREAFKDESRRLDSHGGPNPDTNHNKIQSPGKKYRKQDGE
jgi:hypothetical protein